MKRKHDFSRLVAAAACVLLMLASGSIAAQEPAAQPAGAQTVTFRFVAGDDMFYTPWGGNASELARLLSLIDLRRTDIAAGSLPIHVDSYCASLPTQQENLRTAFVRANRVKSELIVRKALKEADFLTANHATAYLGTHKDVVVVTLHIPANEVGQQQPEPAPEHPRQEIPAIEDDEPDIKEEKLPGQEATPATAGEPSPALKTSAPAKPYCLAVDFSLGLGYTRSAYDSFTVTDGVRVHKDRNQSKNLWGPTQAGISLVWTIGGRE